MNIIELPAAESRSAAALQDCDVCIVGSGPAGATLAAELSGGNLRVTLLESGGFARLAEADALNEVENVGRARALDQWSVRNRIVGGSSHTWGGRCAPFDEIDFEVRDWAPHSGWPIRAESLAPYMARTTPHLGLAAGDGYSDARFWAIAGREPPAHDPDPALLLPFFWQFSRDPEESYPYEYMRFGRSLAARLGPNVTLATGATVLRIDPVEGGRAVRSVEFADPQGRTQTLNARSVILCAGGVEIPRLLLASDTMTPGGLGNGRDLVGRYLMDHLRGALGQFDDGQATALKKRFGRYNVGDHFFRAGLRLSPEVQRRERLLNCAVWLGEALSPDDPWAALRRIAGGKPQWPGDALAVVGNPGLIASGALDYFVRREGVPRKLEALELVCMTEQLPDPDSRITLSERRDRLGMRLPRIDWRIHEAETRTLVRTAELVAEEFARLGLPAVTLPDWARDGAALPPTFLDVAHPSGATRMSDDPATGVVDANCQVHGVEGLYVTGSSVFPTVGHCNPTQTIVALAVRLADHIKARAGSVRPAPARSESVVTMEGRRKRILVTGAAGRIGRVLVADLVERGYQVRATTSKRPPSAEDAAGAIEWRRFDFLEALPSDYDGLVAGCDGVVHLAAVLGKMAQMEAVNTLATGHLAEAAERAAVKGFCYASTVSVYGSGRQRLMAEDAPVLTTERDVPSEYWALDYVRMYGRTKLAGEHAIAAVAQRTPYVVLRPAVVVNVSQMIEIREWSLFKRSLGAHRHAHHIYVGDVSDAMIWSLERAFSGGVAPGAVETFNLAEDEFAEPTHAAFMRKAYRVSGDRRFRVVQAPWVGDWLHDFLRFRTLPLRNPLWRMRFPNDRLRAAGYRPRFGMAKAHALALEVLRSGAGVTPPSSSRETPRVRTASAAPAPVQVAAFASNRSRKAAPGSVS
jgi:choline dehydrogenase-like flavoprotein/nucleoside-diphosphate-sugar epimerase